MPADPSGLVLNISAVERETGLSKDVLRMWERRYGFPKPPRDDNGERQYSLSEIAKLRAIKRLMDVGVRPGKIIHSPLDELNALVDAKIAPRRVEVAPAIEREVLALLQSDDTTGLQSAFAGLLMRHGLQRFVLDTLTLLNRAVGDAWMHSELQIFEEHLYTEQLKIALRMAINQFQRPIGTPRVLLTTLPGEQHSIGLLMVEALLVPEGACCVSLGTQTPVDEIRGAAHAYKANIVALSFSAAFPVRQAGDGLAALRRQLPPPTALWAGGETTRRIRKTLPGVVLLPDLAAIIGALKSWRAHAASTPRSATGAQ
jgi:DNA-binding transcriptional MerR regulator/methylmalonyl-CoA mutase cobalamin-binding subunit